MTYNVFIPLSVSKKFIVNKEDAQKYLMKGETVIDILDINDYNSF